MNSERDAIWIERFEHGTGDGPTVAVKDNIDVAGSITTAGCRALALRAEVATRDATCVARVRAQGGRIAGKTNLHELAFGVTGVNPWYGTPPNPADPGRVPGGSSSGSAAAVALGESDVALGTDTAGSVRIPAACCGVVGLKTTYGRIPIDGVWPLAPSFDTVGPLARNVADIVRAMRLIEPEFEQADGPATAVGRIDFNAQIEIDPVIDEAIDAALRRAELDVQSVPVDGWESAWRDQQTLVGVEARVSNAALFVDDLAQTVGSDTLQRFRDSEVPSEIANSARKRGDLWGSTLRKTVERFGVLAMPTLARRPPSLGERGGWMPILTAPISLAGLPAIALPVPADGRPPASLQLVASAGSEGLLIATAALVERAIASS
jgi:amidase